MLRSVIGLIAPPFEKSTYITDPSGRKGSRYYIGCFRKLKSNVKVRITHQNDVAMMCKILIIFIQR